MSWLPGITSPLAAWLFALLVPLIVFYFLKLRRTRVEIPSLALWMSVIEDQRVNSPFQRFKRNLLLLFQIAALCLLVLAAMQPFVKGDAQRARYLPILIDCSASMGATASQGQTRLDIAKQEIREIIENLLPDQRLTLITVSNSAQRRTEFTNNQRVLLQALDQIEVTEVPSRLEEGLQLAQALARSFPIDAIRFYSDGNLPLRSDDSARKAASVDFDLPFELQFHRIEAPAANIGITAFNATRRGADAWNVFVRVLGSSDRQTAARVELQANGAPVGEESVVLEPGESQRLLFDYQSEEAASLQVRLVPDGTDALQTDNVAFLELPRGRPLSVYCPPTLTAFRHSLSGLEGVELLPDESRDPQRAVYDLVISDDPADRDLESATSLWVGLVPDDLNSLVTMENELATVVDWKRDDLLLQHVMFQGVEFTDRPMLSPGISEGDFEDLGYEILVQGDTGPMILKRRDGRHVAVHLLFHTDQSTLPYRVGFPVFIANVVRFAREQADLSDVRGWSTGVLPPLALSSGQDYVVSTPSGQTLPVSVDEEGVLKGIPAPTVGEYDVRQDGETVRRVGVGLLDERETSLVGVDEIQFREVSVRAGAGRAATDRPLWRLLAYGAFAFLLAEWWLALRRPTGAALP